MRYSLAVHSIVLIVAASVLTIMLHECAHFIVAFGYGLHPELHHNFVYYQDDLASSTQQMLIAGAGPVFSWIQGEGCLQMAKRISTKSALTLWLLWMGLYGYLTFFGYLFIAPFFTTGDTGKVFALLHLPFGVVVGISVLGIVLLNVFLTRQAKEFGYYGDHTLSIAQRANQLILLPIGCVMASCVLQWPVGAFVDLLAPLLMPLSFMVMYGHFRRRVRVVPTVDLEKIPWIWIAFLVGLVLIFRMLNYPVGSV